MKKGIFLYLFSLTIFLTISHYSVAEANPKVIKNIEIKGGPAGLAIDEKGRRLIVLNKASGKFAVIDENDFSLIKEIPLNKKINTNLGTRSVAYDPGLNRIYIATGDSNVLCVDGISYEILFEIDDGGNRRFIPEAAVSDSNLYLLDWYGYIHQYDTKGNFKASINIKDFSPSYMNIGLSNKLYVTSNGKRIIVIDAEKGKTIATIPIPALSIPESGLNSIFVAGSGKLYLIDIRDFKVKKTVEVDYPSRGGGGMALNPNTGHLFMATFGDRVEVIDVKKAKKLKAIKACEGVYSITVNKMTNTVYAACPGRDTITVIKDD